jgi:CBS domain-containing protein
MTLFAKDIMVKSFDSVHKDAPIDAAIKKILNGKVRETGHKTMSLMAVDDSQQLAGVLTLFDILYHLRPTFLNYGVDGDMLSWHGQLKKCIEDLKGKKVKDVMSKNITVASPDEHLMVLLDRMVKNKYHRLPVLENNKPVGIVYLADIYHYLFK